ncbi:MAG: HEPN domain-containing protein [Prevotellaceae bacterium]|jgi:uncharacterized protein (UPF0332 family)|nr:HEPN domain-containing protein [Prevotellaceae bacterium]
MSLTNEERDIIVEHRLANAAETLTEAKDLINLGHWRGAANRLYYACYYAVSALLIKYEHPTRTHSGVIGLFGKYFVLTNIFGKEQNKLYQKLFDLRQDGDYSDWIKIEEDDIKPLLRPAEQFIAEIKNLINQTN